MRSRSPWPSLQLLLFTNVVADPALIETDRAHTVARRPEMQPRSSAVRVTAAGGSPHSPLQIADRMRHAVLRRDAQAQADLVEHRLPFEQFHTLGAGHTGYSLGMKLFGTGQPRHRTDPVARACRADPPTACDRDSRDLARVHRRRHRDGVDRSRRGTADCADSVHRRSADPGALQLRRQGSSSVVTGYRGDSTVWSRVRRGRPWVRGA